MTEEKVSVEAAVREISRRIRKKDNAEEKMRIVLEGLRGETSIAELCRRELFGRSNQKMMGFPFLFF